MRKLSGSRKLLRVDGITGTLAPKAGVPAGKSRIIYVGTYAEFMIEFLPEFMPEDREMFPILYNGSRNREHRR